MFWYCCFPHSLRGLPTRYCWGSKQEAERGKRLAYGTNHRFGWNGVFVTFNFNFVNQPNLMAAVGVMEPDMADQHILLGTVPTRAARYSRLIDHPFQTALNFLDNIDAILECLVAFLADKLAPAVDGGVFGPVTNYFGNAEENGSRALHAHFLLHIAGMPDYDDMVQNIANDAFQSALADFVDSILLASFGNVNLTEAPCAVCGHRCLDEVSLPDDAGKVRLGQHRPEPYAVSCSNCRTAWTASESHRKFQAMIDYDIAGSVDPTLHALEPDTRQWRSTLNDYISESALSEREVGIWPFGPKLSDQPNQVVPQRLHGHQHRGAQLCRQRRLGSLQLLDFPRLRTRQGHRGRRLRDDFRRQGQGRRHQIPAYP